MPLSVPRLTAVLLHREASSFHAVSSKIYTLAALTVGIHLICTQVRPLPPALTWEEGRFWVLKPVFVRWVATELLALLFGECVTEGSFCHRFSHIFEGAYSRIAGEVFCLCLFLRSSSDLLVGQDWALEALTRTLPLGSLRSVLVVVGQHACSPSLLELGVRLVAQVAERVV